MVREIKKNSISYYQCEACSFAYKEKEIAQECEDWCKKNSSCNLEIIKEAVKV